MAHSGLMRQYDKSGANIFVSVITNSLLVERLCVDMVRQQLDSSHRLSRLRTDFFGQYFVSPISVLHSALNK